MKQTLLILVVFLTCTSPAAAQVAECPDLTTLQQLAGYVTLLGIAKLLGALAIAAGLLFIFGGLLVRIISTFRHLLEGLAYVASAALIGSGYWLTNTEYLTWTVFIGCLLFAGSVMATIWIHKLKSDDPKPLATLFMLVWGAVAVFYQMPEVGFLAALALVTLLGFSVVVTPFCYAFGYNDEKALESSTVACLLLLNLFCVVHVFVPDAPAAVTVFKPGIFWVTSFVGFIGLLCISSKWYNTASNYFVHNLLTVILFGAALTVGLLFAINPLAGMAGTFLVLYLASKPLEIPADSMISFGVILLMFGGVLGAAWWYGTEHAEFVSQYLTTQL